jgi:hypothetical protein
VWSGGVLEQWSVGAVEWNPQLNILLLLVSSLGKSGFRVCSRTALHSWIVSRMIGGRCFHLCRSHSIPVDRISGSDRLSSNPHYFKCLRLKQATSLDIQRDCILPDTQPLIPPVLVLSLHPSHPPRTTPVLHHSTAPSLFCSAHTPSPHNEGQMKWRPPGDG